MQLNENILLQDWIDIWYETYAKPFVKKSTLVSYECYIRRHIKPAIGKLKLCDLNAFVFQRFFNEQYECGNCRKGSPANLSPKTLLNMRMMLHEAISDAVNNNLIVCNYVEHVKMPKQHRQERRVLTHTEQSRLLTTLKASDDPFAFGVFLCLTTGIRIGELCGLYWSDFVLVNNLTVLKIRRTLNRIPDLERGRGTIINVSEPKSTAAKREIPLHDTILDKLRFHRMQQSELVGNEYVYGDCFVFSRIPGKPVEPKFMQKRFNRLLKDADVQNVSFHALRHTFATRALECNIDYKTLSVLLGHADVTTTMNLYQHVLIEQKQNAMSKIMQQF